MAESTVITQQAVNGLTVGLDLVTQYLLSHKTGFLAQVIGPVTAVNYTAGPQTNDFGGVHMVVGKSVQVIGKKADVTQVFYMPKV